MERPETAPGHSIGADLLTQASDATTGRAEGLPPSLEQLRQIVEFELGLFTAQSHDSGGGSLSTSGALGGPEPLTTEPFCIGINDPLNLLPSMPGACETSSGDLVPAC